MSTIHYAEDLDSLLMIRSVTGGGEGGARFLLHAPVFVFLVQAIDLVFDSVAIVFSLIGGVSVYLIIVYTCKSLRVSFFSLEGLLIAWFIFFNPLLWIVSNQALPYTLALALSMAIFYYLLIDHYKPANLMRGWGLLGIVSGISLVFVPFLLLPASYALYKKASYRKHCLWVLPGVLGWLLSLLLLDVPGGLLNGQLFYGIGLVGHADLSFSSYFWLLTDLTGAVFMHIPSISIGILLLQLVFMVFGLLVLLDFDYPREKLHLVLASLLLYSIFAWGFYDIFHDIAVLLPLLPFLCVCMAYGTIYFLVNFNRLFVKILCGIYLVISAMLGIYAASSSASPSAIAQVSEYLSRLSQQRKLCVISDEQVIRYLQAQHVPVGFSTQMPDKDTLVQKEYDLLVVIQPGSLWVNAPISAMAEHRRFSHFPGKGRRWSDIDLYLLNTCTEAKDHTLIP